MLNNQQIEALRPAIKVLKIIIGAMPVGVVLMTALFYVLKDPPKFNQTLELTSWIGIGMAVMSYAASFIAPSIIREAMTKEMIEKSKADDEPMGEFVVQRLFGVFQSSMIIKFALIEGAMFANVMMWYLSGSVFNLVVVGIGLLLMAMSFPFEGGVVRKLESMLESIGPGKNQF